MLKHRTAFIALGASLSIGAIVHADSNGFKIDITSGFEDRWPTNGDTDFNDRSITTSIGDVDGDGFPDVVALTPNGSGARVGVRKGWDGTIKGVTTDLSTGRSVLTGHFETGDIPTQDQVVVAPGAGQPGVIQEFAWSATNPDGTPAAGHLNSVRTTAPFGSGYTGGIAVAAGDVDGDGFDDLIAVGQTPLSPRIAVMSVSPGKAGSPPTWTPTLTISPPNLLRVGAMNVAAGPLLASTGPHTISQIATTYTDPDTGATDLAVYQGSTPVSFVDASRQKSGDVYAWARSTLHTQGIIHRDLATRCCMADLDGDGTDEIILSGNDGAEPIVSILTLASVADPDGTSTDLQVIRERVLDLETVLRNYDQSELSSLIFNPSVTSTVFSSTDPDAALADPMIMPPDSGTLFLTADFVPEPTSIGLFGLAAIGVLKRRRTR